MRLLDCKEIKCAEIKRNAPQSIDSLCAPCRQHFKENLEFLEASNMNYYLDTKLVRGLDYYTRTSFLKFFLTKEKVPRVNLWRWPREDATTRWQRYWARETFRRWAEESGWTGWQWLCKKRKSRPNQRERRKFLIQLSQSAKQKSMSIIEMFRTANIYIAQSISKDNLNSQLSLASKMNVPYVLILGQKEVLENSIMVREMSTGSRIRSH